MPNLPLDNEILEGLVHDVDTYNMMKFMEFKDITKRKTENVQLFSMSQSENRK